MKPSEQLKAWLEDSIRHYREARLGNNLTAVKRHLAQLEAFRSTEKAQKAAIKLEVARLAHIIGFKLQVGGQRAFSPEVRAITVVV